MRELIHDRQIQAKAYKLDNNLWEIVGTLTDSKTYDFPNKDRGIIKAGDFLHEMELRLTLDENLMIQSCEAFIHNGPYNLCPEITPNFSQIAGIAIQPGVYRKIHEKTGGIQGCRHLNDLLKTVLTTAIQAIFPLKDKKLKTDNSKSALLNTCHMYREDGPIF